MVRYNWKVAVKRYFALILCMTVILTGLPVTSWAKVWSTPDYPTEIANVNYKSSPMSGSEYHDYSIRYYANLNPVQPRITGDLFTVTHTTNVSQNAVDEVVIKGRGMAVLEAQDTRWATTGVRVKDETPASITIEGEDLTVYLVGFGKIWNKNINQLTVNGENNHIYIYGCDIGREVSNDSNVLQINGYPDGEGGYGISRGNSIVMYNSAVDGKVDYNGCEAVPENTYLTPESLMCSLQAYGCIFKSDITLSGYVDASCDNCRFYEYDLDDMEYNYKAPVTLRYDAVLSMTECMGYDINSEGHNTLFMHDTDIYGNVRVSGSNEDLTVYGIDDSGNYVDYKDRNGLTMVLAGQNTVKTRNRTNGEGVCPDIMVAESSVFMIKDDPSLPDVGELTIGAYDNDGGHYYCAAIGGMPSVFDPRPNGMVIMDSGILNAWANTDGAVIGGSAKEPYLSYETREIEESPYWEYVLDKNGDKILIESKCQPGFTRDGGKVWIRGGVVNAEAMAGGAAIGGAYGGNGGEFTITGGTVNAKAGLGAAAIGGGAAYQKDPSGEYNGKGDLIGGSGGKIKIQGGCVVNCYSNNNFYDNNGVKYDKDDPADPNYKERQGYVIGASERQLMTVDDSIEIKDVNGVSPVVILQQDVSYPYTPNNSIVPEIDASWDNYIFKNCDEWRVSGPTGESDYFKPVSIDNSILILIGRECCKNEDGIPVDKENRPLMRKDGTFLTYDDEGNEQVADEYDYAAEVRDISTHIISGYEWNEEIPLKYNNYKVRGQIHFPAWPDPWYSDENNTEIILPENSTITLMDGAVMNVGEGFSILGTEDQLIVEDGAVIQGRGMWPGRPEDRISEAPEQDDIQSVLKLIQEQNLESQAGTGSENRTVVTHLGVAKASDGKRFIIPGDSPDEIKSVAKDQKAEVLTIINAGYCGFILDNGIWKLLQAYGNTVVSLVENGSLSAIPGAYTTINNRFDVTLKENNGTVEMNLKSVKLTSPDYVVFEGARDDLLTVKFTPDDNYNDDLAFVVDIDPQDNMALFSVPKFYNSEFALKTIAPLKNKSALRYGGVLAFHTPIADLAGIDINQLQIDYGKKTTLGGIEGGGKVEVPAFGGFPVAGGAQMHLNTFGGERELSMDVELETPIFEGAFEASFKEARGVILPDTLYAELAVGEGSIPLVPPTVVGYLQGGGLGFEGLADTVNMDSFGAPPIRLKVAAEASIIDVIDGWARVSVGPSGFDLDLEGIKIKDLEMIKKYGVSASWDAGKKKIKGKTYWGISTDMSQYLVIAVGLKGKDVLSASGTTAFGGFSGYVVEGDTAYFIYQLHGSGNLNGSLNIPKKIVGPFPFKDYKLASAEVGFYAAANASSKVNASRVKGSPEHVVRDLAKNAKIDFDAAVGAKAVIGGGSILPNCNVRVIYVFGDKAPSFSGGKGSGAALDLEKVVNSSEVIDNNYAMIATVEDEASGETVPVIVEVGAETIAVLDDENVNSETEGEPIEDEVILSQTQEPGSFDAQVRSSAVGNVMIAVKLAPSGSVSDVSINCEGSNVELVEAQYDEDGNQINNTTANYYTDDEEGILYFAPAKEGNYTISSSSGFESAEVIKMNDFAAIQDAQLGSGKASYKLSDTIEDHKYKMQVVLGDSQGSGDYLIAESDVLTGSETYDDELAFSLTGSEVPTGDYYPSVVMLEYVEAEGENGEVLETWALADQKSFDQTVRYTNNVIPSAPSGVSLKASGNETMTASWKEADYSKADHVNYQVTVYNEDGADTGLGFTTEDTSIVMDMSSFEKGKEYSVGVKALVYADAQTGDYQTSYEAVSDKVLLVSAVLPEITYSDNVIMGEDNTYKLSVSQNNAEITINSDKPLNYTVRDINDESGEVLLSAKGKDEVKVIIPARVDEAAVNGENSDDSRCMNLEIMAQDPTTGDYVLDHINVSFDTSPPPLAVDNMGIFPLMRTEGGLVANITGQAEAGSTVLIWSNNSQQKDRILTGKSTAEDGTFNVSLEFEERSQASDGTLSVQAVDRAGNYSEPVAISIPDDTITLSFDPNGEGATCSTAGMDIVKNTVVGKLPTAYWQNDEYLFDGWYTEPVDGEEVTALSSFTQDSVIYAHWSKASVVRFVLTGSNRNADCETSAIVVRNGTPIGELPVPVWSAGTKRGFFGWYTSAEGGEKITEESTFEGDTSVYPHFDYYVTLRFDSGLGTCNESEMIVPYEKKIDSYPVPVSRGYEFAGWYDKDENPVTDETTYSSDTELIAKWIRNTDELEVTQNGCKDNEELSDPEFTAPKDMVGEANISYIGVGDTRYQSNAKPQQAGTYKVVVQCNTYDKAYVGSAEFTILKTGIKDYSITPPEKIENLVYDKKTHDLITEGSTDNGVMKYALGDNGETSPESGWKEDVPTAVNAGTYYVWYQVIADEFHVDSEPACVEVIIEKAKTVYTKPDDQTVACNTTVTDLKLPKGFEPQDPQQVLTIGENLIKLKYTPDDVINYDVVEDIEIKVTLTHSYSISYEWSDDKKTCIGKAVCENDESHVLTEEATVTGVKTKDPAIGVKGTTTYTAVFKENGLFETQTVKADDIPALKDEEGGSGNGEQQKAAPEKTVLTADSVKADVVVTSGPGEKPAVEYKISNDTAAENITVPDTVTVNGVTYEVTSIAADAFKNNKNLESITIGKNVEIIGDNAFAGCKNLTKVTLGDNVESIGSGAFSGCVSLKSITLPKKIKRIGNNVFKGAKKLKKLKILTKLLTDKTISKKAFKGLNRKAVIKVPGKKKKLYTKLFKKKGLPKGVKIK